MRGAPVLRRGVKLAQDAGHAEGTPRGPSHAAIQEPSSCDKNPSDNRNC